MDTSDFLESLVGVLEANGIRFAVIGGQAVNAYVAPLVSLDLDLAVAVEQVPEAESLLAGRFHVERFAHSFHVSAPDSDLHVQIQTDPAYGEMVERAEIRDVLGLGLPVARVEDVLQGKVWAAMDKERRASKRQKDLADISRLLEAYPELRGRVPEEILSRLV